MRFSLGWIDLKSGLYWCSRRIPMVMFLLLLCALPSVALAKGPVVSAANTGWLDGLVALIRALF